MKRRNDLWSNFLMFFRLPALQRYAPLACAAAVAVCVLIAHPVVEMGMVDDWSYIYSARRLASTGHVVYNGWSAPIQGWQMLLSALFIKVWGFSFTAARTPVLLVAMLTAYVLQRSLVLLGINEWNATLGTLTVVLSPLFLPLAFNMMTDVPGLFCLVLCLYCCLRALGATTDRAAVGWLAVAAVGNMLDGTVRQTAWLGVLVMVPSTAWLIRRRRGALAAGAVLWLAGVAAIAGCLRWFSRQPNSLTERLIDRQFESSDVAPLGVLLSHGGLAILLYLLPVLLGFVVWFPFRNRFRTGLLVLCSGAPLLLLLVERALHGNIDPWLAPFFWNTVSARGLMDVAELQGVPPVVLPFRLRLVVSAIVSFATFCFLLSAVRPPLLQRRRRVASALSWRALLLLLGPTTAVYFLLLLPRAALHGLMLDRYLLPILLFLLGPLLLLYQERVQERLPLVSVGAVILLAGFGVAGMHDVFALDQARLQAIDEIRSSGVERTAIRGGWDYDGWTQIETTGSINGALVTQLSRPSKTAAAPRPPKEECRYWFTPYAPSVKPRYALSYDADVCSGPAPFPPVWFRTWLLRRGETVYVVRVR